MAERYNPRNYIIDYESPQDLEKCSACESDLVEPIIWDENTDDTTWWVEVSCPECAWSCTHLAATRNTVEAYDTFLNDSRDEIKKEADTLAIDLFIGALATNNILPEDF